MHTFHFMIVIGFLLLSALYYTVFCQWFKTLKKNGRKWLPFEILKTMDIWHLYMYINLVHKKWSNLKAHLLTTTSCWLVCLFYLFILTYHRYYLLISPFYWCYLILPLWTDFLSHTSSLLTLWNFFLFGAPLIPFFSIS